MRFEIVRVDSATLTREQRALIRAFDVVFDTVPTRQNAAQQKLATAARPQ